MTPQVAEQQQRTKRQKDAGVKAAFDETLSWSFSPGSYEHGIEIQVEVSSENAMGYLKHVGRSIQTSLSALVNATERLRVEDNTKSPLSLSAGQSQAGMGLVLDPAEIDNGFDRQCFLRLDLTHYHKVKGKDKDKAKDKSTGEVVPRTHPSGTFSAMISLVKKTTYQQTFFITGR